MSRYRLKAFYRSTLRWWYTRHTVEKFKKRSLKTFCEPWGYLRQGFINQKLKVPFLEPQRKLIELFMDLMQLNNVAFISEMFHGSDDQISESDIKTFA